MRSALFTLVLTSAIAAQGSVSDGGTTYAQNSLPTSTTSTSGLSNFTATGTDSTFQHWWYYCLDRDAGGSAFNSSGRQVTQSYVGNTMRLTWANVDSRGLSADWILTVHNTGAGAGIAVSRMTITSNSTVPIRLALYSYTDIDLCDSHRSNIAVGSMNGTDMIHTITSPSSCGDTLQIYARSPALDRADVFPLVRDQILAQGGNCPMLGPRFAPVAGSFGPGDYTGAFQWNVLLAPGQSTTQSVVLGHNTSTRPCATAASSTTTCTPGTAGTNGNAVLSTTLVPVIGNTGELAVGNGLAGANGVYAAGAPTCQSILGVSLAVVQPAAVTLPMTFSATGDDSLFIPIPNNAELCGATLAWQVLFLDPGSAAAVPVASTNGEGWTIGV